LSWGTKLSNIRNLIREWPIQVSIEEQELPTLPEHLSSPPDFSGVHVTRSLVLGTGYEYDGNVFVAWVLQVRRAEVVTKMINRFPDMDTYYTEINHVLLASRGYEYDDFCFLKYIVFRHLLL